MMNKEDNENNVDRLFRGKSEVPRLQGGHPADLP
jgi:hypothetical protein